LVNKNSLAWATVPAPVGGISLLIALTGLVWDVAYHVDHGRDVTLLNPPHAVILAGLAGIAAAAGLAVALSTLAEAPTGLRLGPLRVPYAAVPLGAMAAGSLAGFPLDDLWHRTYGVDVTLWSPTHLTMIGGAALATFALPLLAVEAGLEAPRRPFARALRLAIVGGLLLALSAFQLEYDFGVPQWQAVYQPLLIALTGGLALTAARAALGPWGAVKGALWFLLARAVLALAVGPGLGHTVPRFPLFLGSAVAVELAFRLAGRRGPAAAALLAGALAGTAGLAAEWGWNHLWGAVPWSPSLLPLLWLPVLAAVLGAVPGTALGRVLARQPADLPAWAVVGSIAGLAVLLAVPLPRDGSPAAARVTAAPAGAERQAVDRFGLPAVERDVQVEVSLTPAGAAEGADWFEVLAWQGGGRVAQPLVQVAPGRYRAAGPVPTGGSWKTIVYLARGRELAALPVSLPADPQFGSRGLPVEPTREGRFEPAQRLLTSEAHGGPPWVAATSYAVLLGLWALWVALLLYAGRAVSRRSAPAPAPASPASAGPASTSRPRSRPARSRS
jgi:hypothetical protein